MESDTRPDVPHWHAGFNRPGFLPESEPGVFSSFEAAREALADDMEGHAAAEATWADEHDCDDVPCPTYGDSCAWDRASAVRAERGSLLASDGPSWDGGAAGLAYWVKPCGVARCVDKLVAQTAAEFADADDSPLGVLASTGAIVDGAAEEADESRQAATAADQSDLEVLCSFIAALGLRGPVDGWAGG